MIDINFLWHMHQPDYRHPATGVPILPWVRLHGVKGYRDLLDILEQYDQASCTVNFSGVLLDQLEGVIDRQELDCYALISRRRPSELTFDERKFIITRFFSANEHALIKPHSRYFELMQKRDGLIMLQGLDGAVEKFTDQDITDLIVWFNLAWIGFSGQGRMDVKELVAKARNYTVEDQSRVVAIHLDLLGEIVPGYRALSQAGRIELSFTPFHHPILPLLCDLRAEGYADEKDALPEFAYLEDARLQVQLGIAAFERAFGSTPSGAWPAEGSVSDAALKVLAGEGLSWGATDQQNLPPLLQQKPLYHLQPYAWQGENSEMAMFFRDTRLSDNIGFEYARWQPNLAGEHFVAMIRGMAEQTDIANPVVTVALDGENPWETYIDGGEGFLRTVAELIATEPAMRCNTPSQIIGDRELPAVETVSAGSWIGGNFNIWSRHPETRIAWRRLARARNDLRDTAQGQVLSEILAAEGSDWFWWYGDDFVTKEAKQFDELFRSHLIAAYEATGSAVPDEMYAPIYTERRPEIVGEVKGYIRPALDGRITTYFEWRNGVKIEANGWQSSMARSEPKAISILWYGFSPDCMYIRLDLSPQCRDACRVQQAAIELQISQGDYEYKRKFGLGEDAAAGREESDYAIDEIVEIRINLDDTKLVRGELAYLALQISADGRTCVFPESGRIPVNIIPEDFDLRNWTV